MTDGWEPALVVEMALAAIGVVSAFLGNETVAIAAFGLAVLFLLFIVISELVEGEPKKPTKEAPAKQ